MLMAALLMVHQAAAHEHLHDHRSFRQLLQQGVESAAGGKQPNAIITPEVAVAAAAIAATAVPIPKQPAMSSGEVAAAAAAAVPAQVPAGGWKRCNVTITRTQQSKAERDLAARVRQLKRLAAAGAVNMSAVGAAAGSVTPQQSMIPITTYVHVMTFNGQGVLSGTQISSQMSVLNNAFNRFGFEFRLVGRKQLLRSSPQCHRYAAR
jgi:hypothetical protein